MSYGYITRIGDKNFYLTQKHEKEAGEKKIAAEKVEKRRIEKRADEAIQAKKIKNMQDGQATSMWGYYSNPELIAYKIREAVKA